MSTSPDVLDRLLTWGRIDFRPSHRQPDRSRLVLATVLSVALSLVADAALVALGTHLFPATTGYVHFGFGDYAKLTIVGVLIACAGWPIVTRVSSAPRWVFCRLAVAVTLVLFLPDVWLLLQGASAQAVAVLLAMHVAIAVITYNLLVRLAPVRPAADRQPAHAPAGPPA